MKNLILTVTATITAALATTLFSQGAYAVQQKNLTLSESCKNTVETAVFEELGKDDETFSIVSSTLLYGGTLRGLNFSPVVLVKTSDEVEPRDVIVITTWTRDDQTNAVGCKVTHIETVADGLTVDFEE